MTVEEQAIIVIVDDNPTNLRVLGDYLRSCGYKVLVATSGDRALAQLERIKPDLVLMDVMMPGIDGFETCRRMKENESTREIPVIFMTALTDTAHKIQGFRAGAVDYVTKPFQQEEVSQRIQTHLTLRRQRREVEELNATKDKIFSVIGHDLRGPFTAILGFAEVFTDSERNLSREQVAHFGKLIYQSAVNAHNLLENLLTWADLQRGGMVRKPTAVDLALVLDEAVEVLSLSARAKGVAILSAVSSPVWVQADPNMLSTIIRNLVSNALKFTPEHGMVAISVVESDSAIEVQVQDTGIGIAPDQLESILREANRHSSLGVRGEIGTGLGLLLCRDFVQWNGGRLWAESSEGEGSIFHFTVPRAEPLELSEESECFRQP